MTIISSILRPNLSGVLPQTVVPGRMRVERWRGRVGGGEEDGEEGLGGRDEGKHLLSPERRSKSHVG